MDFSKEQECREEFKRILNALAQNQNFRNDPSERSRMYQKLEKLYYSENEAGEFRHYYSDIFQTLTEIQEANKGDFSILCYNIDHIYRNYYPHNPDANGRLIDISDNIKKLYDHVSLDIARIQYSEKLDRAATGEAAIAELKSQVTDANYTIDQLGNQVKESQKQIDREDDQIKQIVSELEESRDQFETKMSDQQKDYIAILGIFASVVIVFVAGITFSASVLESMNRVSIYRLVLVILLLGFVLVNTIHYLMETIFRISRKVTPKAESETGCEGKSQPERKSKFRWWYGRSWIWRINLIFLSMLIVLLAAWAFSLQKAGWSLGHILPWVK